MSGTASNSDRNVHIMNIALLINFAILSFAGVRTKRLVGYVVMILFDVFIFNVLTLRRISTSTLSNVLNS